MVRLVLLGKVRAVPARDKVAPVESLPADAAPALHKAVHKAVHKAATRRVLSLHHSNNNKEEQRPRGRCSLLAGFPFSPDLGGCLCR